MLGDEDSRFSERGISRIQRDVEELEYDRERWSDVFGGPRRRAYTFDCLGTTKEY
jgi:hypothetical protein